jgi:pimeloyl-ACP methyl ester carboxylesterase
VPLSPGLQELPVSGAAASGTPIVYLHGFASSPDSTKARYFDEQLRRHGRSLICPDLNQPDFETLTMSRMLGQLAALLDGLGAPATLIGSSLGGTLAVLAAARLGPRVERLVLMAPAVMFAKPGHHLLPPERIETWRREGALPFFHYGANEERRLDFSFYEDSLQHDAFQGLRDAAVDYRTVEQFARDRSNVTLSLLDDDHQLAASLPRMWLDIEPFLGLVD